VFISTLATVGDGSRLGATPDGTPNGRQHLHAVADHHPVDLAAPHSFERCGIRVARGLKTEPAIAAALDWQATRTGRSSGWLTRPMESL
jgi:hypothetical protein